MTFVELPLTGGRVFVNPSQVTRVEAFTADACNVHFVGGKDNAVYVPLDPNTVLRKLEAKG